MMPFPNATDLMREVSAVNAKVAAGMERLSTIKDSEVEIATTPKDEILRTDKVTLSRYRPLTEQRIRTPLLIVYSLIGRYTMTDLQEDRSSGPQTAESRYRRVGGGLGQSQPCRSLAEHRRLRVGIHRRVRDRDVRDDRRGQGQPSRHLRGWRVHAGLCSPGARSGAKPGVGGDTAGLSRRSGGERPRQRVHQRVDPKPHQGRRRSNDRGLGGATGRIHGRNILDADAGAVCYQIQFGHSRRDRRRRQVLELPPYGEMAG